MADESSWKNHVDSIQRGSVTANVEARTAGELVRFEDEYPDASLSESKSPEPTENDRAKAAGYEDKWHQRFAHLPGMPGPDR